VFQARRVIGFLIFILAVQEASAQSVDAEWTVEPQDISVNLFYSGAQIRVRGVTRAGEDLAIVCTGEESTVDLKKKGKVWGLLWMNVGDVSFKHVPLLYQVVSSGKLGDMAAAADLENAGIGIPALEARSAPGKNEDMHRSFLELIKLKEHEGLYSIRERSLEIHPRGAQQEFSATLNFPTTVKPGEYRLQLISFVQGKAVPLAERVLSVRLAGTAAIIQSLSMNHGLAYGILSVVIALAAGLLTGFIFGRGSKKGSH
jgi:uncharacterized protein (TIGR02186 family)